MEHGVDWSAGPRAHPGRVLEAVVRAVALTEEESGPLRRFEREAAVRGALEGVLGYRVVVGRFAPPGFSSIEHLHPDGKVRSVSPCNVREFEMWECLVRFGVDIVSRIVDGVGSGGSGARMVESAQPKESYL